MVILYNGILFIIKKKIIPFTATQMQTEILTLSKKETNTIYITYIQNLKYGKMNLSTEQKHSQPQRTHLWFPKGKGGEGYIRSWD